jgi:hypothetical protein
MGFMKVEVCIWICPSCKNYYASSSAGDTLAEQVNTDAKGQATFARSQCPDCKGERVPCYLEIELVERDIVVGGPPENN